MGNDVAAGTGASNSCASSWDQTTCEKKAEYANPYIRPEQFAKQIVALAKWLGDADLIWESGGPGRQFGDKIIELGYSNIYYRRQEEALSKKVTEIPGVAQTVPSKTAIMSGYRSAVEKGQCVNHSKESLEECNEYIYRKTDGCPVHSKSSSKTDPSGANANHGDRCMADALAWKLLSERIYKPKPKEPDVPVGSLAWRNQQREEQKKNKKDGW
jgi:hypothetical protein